MFNKQKLKRYFIVTIIASLVLGAILGILALLFGSFGWFEGRIMLSTLAIGVMSITSLANLRNLESDHASYRRFAWASITFSMIALLLALSLIWISVDNTPWKPTLVFFILAVSTSHASLLLSERAKSKMIDVAVSTTLACIALVAGLLIYLVVLQSVEVGETFYRLLGVFAIIDVLGTIVTPILARLAKNQLPNLPKDTSSPSANNPSAPTTD
jgi:hypothetical protein